MVLKKNDSFVLVEKLAELRQNTIYQLSSKNLFAQKPTVRFVPSRQECPLCGSALNVYYTDVRKLVTLHIGGFQAHSTFLKCHCHTTVYAPEKLQCLAPKHCNYGYDIMVYIGRELFTKFRTIADVKQTLNQKNVIISDSEISYLAARYVVYLSIAHNQITDKLKTEMYKNGGYILHFDGTCQTDSPHLMSALDEISGFVLHNVKIPTENTDDVVKMLDQIKYRYGSPIAIVSDMAQAFSNAIKEVFGTVSHFVCHFHFLSDIGIDLLSSSYDFIRKKLKAYKICHQLRYRLRMLEQNNQAMDLLDIGKNLENSYIDLITQNCNDCLIGRVCYVLIVWCLDAKSSGHGYGFPFDCPHFELLQRLIIMNDKLIVIKQLLSDKKMENNTSTNVSNRLVDKLLADLQELIADNQLKGHCLGMSEKTEVFDKLRQALHITLPNTNNGLNDNGEEVEIKTIEAKVKMFREEISTGTKYQKNEYHKMLEQIDKYWIKLFADPIEIINPKGEKTVIQPQRTNNLLEQFFRAIKRGYSKRSGNSKFNKVLQAMIADTPLVKNLENPEYLNILLNGNQTIEERFAQIDTKTVIQKMKTINHEEEKIPSHIKKAIRKTKIMKIFLNL
jgi:hypothetical protein